MNIHSTSGRTPTVFVSSTCYDLGQIRVDLKSFFEEQLGFEALLSEFDSFPVAPAHNTVENCLRNVKERADLFVLIVGGRYGHVVDSGKSVTNLEYIQARAKKIPRYVFIDKKILNTLPLWRSNRDVDFSSITDSAMLFEFVNSIRDIDGVWVYGFESAQDIIRTLRKQLAYLFFDCLKFYGKIYSDLSHSLNKLDGLALKLAVEKPDYWEYLLLGNLISNEIKKYNYLKNDLIHGLSLLQFNSLDDIPEGVAFVGRKCGEIIHTTASLTALMNNAVQEAVGLPGEPGDVDKIMYVAERYGLAYKNAAEWGLSFATANLEEELQGLFMACRKTSLGLLSQMEDYCKHWQGEMKKLPFYKAQSENENVVINLTLTLDVPNAEEIQEELNILTDKYGG